jgi:hypothetical protein
VKSVEETTVNVRTKILLLSSVAFLCFYGFGIAQTDEGVQVGAASSPAEAVGASSASSPLIYGLLPFLVLLISGLISWYLDRRKKSN